MPASTQSIREIVAMHPSSAQIFARFDIDLCSQADHSLDEACAALQLSVDQVLEKLSDAETHEHGAALADPAALSLSRLIQHIVRVHHQYVRQELPRLTEMAQTLADKRSDRAPVLRDIANQVEDLRADMFAHIQKEEQVLFPFIAQMDQKLIVAYPPDHACFRSITHPVFIMVQEHEAANRIVEELRQLTSGFEAPDWACATHIALFSDLSAFESDLKQHVHLENDVLFPRAIELEGALNGRR
jgi:regulator of cell morphogenesis and NO signaling